MKKDEILSLFEKANGEYISGQSIADALGVTRAAIWKYMDALRTEGYEIESVTRKGYRLVSAPNSLSAGRVVPYLKDAANAQKLIVLPVIDSTNNYLKTIAMQGAADRAVAVADEQTGGRGRQGNSFASPKGTGIYISQLFRPDMEPMKAVNLTCYVAVAVCNGIEKATGMRPQIKWTNDLIMGGKKIGGILTEMSIESETGKIQYIVTGIGINCLQKKEDFPLELQEKAGSIAMFTTEKPDRSRLVAELVNALNEMADQWERGGGDFLSQYRSDCITTGKNVHVKGIGGERDAFAETIDEDFRLVVRFPDGHRETLSSGEVSVRGIGGYV